MTRGDGGRILISEIKILTSSNTTQQHNSKKQKTPTKNKVLSITTSAFHYLVVLVVEDKHNSSHHITQHNISTAQLKMSAPPPQTFPYDYLFKVLVIGDASVGKSSMLLRFTDDSFDEHIQSTIGVDFKVKHVDMSGKRVKLTIWDTAGQERFRTLTSSYYRGAHGVVLVYDVTRTDSFENLEQWLKEVQLYSPNNGESVVKILVGNKIDMERKVDRERADSWARSHGMLFLEASAKTRLGIKQVFMEAVQKILENPEALASAVPGKPKLQIKRPIEAPEDDDEGGCC